MRAWTSRAAVLAICVCAPSVFAAQPPPAQPTCIDSRNSPDYVPGVDASGKPVAPADIPGQGNVEVSTQVYAEVRTKNPQVPSVGVVVNLDGLKQLPPCPPPPKRPIVHEH
jgi:hypothetical protein